MIHSFILLFSARITNNNLFRTTHIKYIMLTMQQLLPSFASETATTLSSWSKCRPRRFQKMNVSFPVKAKIETGLKLVQQIESVVPQPKPINMDLKHVVREYPLVGAAYNMSRQERAFLIDFFLPRMMSAPQKCNLRRGIQELQHNSYPTETAATMKILHNEGGNTLKGQSSSRAKRPPPSLKTGDDDQAESCTIWSYQEDMWKRKLEELVEFHQKHGHCLVPHDWKENPSLAQWIKRQRYQMRLKNEGNRSTMTTERQEKLEELGFVWNTHVAAWEENFCELQAFKDIHGHCNVPKSYKGSKLSVWVKSQRRHYKLLCRGEASSMTEQRRAKLSSIGFEWDPRNLGVPMPNT